MYARRAVARRPRRKILESGSSPASRQAVCATLPRGLSSCLLISNINREEDDDGIRTGAHDLLQKTRVPRRVPAGADFVVALINSSWRGPGAFVRAGAERVPRGCQHQ
jgi:hypothetical protein